MPKGTVRWVVSKRKPMERLLNLSSYLSDENQTVMLDLISRVRILYIRRVTATRCSFRAQ